jgi:hypothetical protein
MEIIFVKNFTIELKDGSAGLFRAGQVIEMNDEMAKEVIKKGYAIRRK